VIQGRRGDEALALLAGAHNRRTGSVQTRAAAFVAKVLQSALANARENGDADENEVYVSEARSDLAPMRQLQRLKPRARGMAHVIRRSASHIHVAVATYEK
jgi:large subunit ribosomal protein L22